MAEAVISLFASKVLTGFFRFIRTKTAEKLQDGGLTDQKLRGLILRELDDIKSKLDGIARKDLGASISSLKKGIKRLNTHTVFVDEPSESGDNNGHPSTSELQSAVITSSETKLTWQIEDAVAPVDAIGKLKIESSESFKSAKESFKEAGRTATLAFHNTALNTEERILASEVRFASGILEQLENPEIAASDCLQYLIELHDMPAIKKIFSVHIKGGIKFWLKKDSRREMVETVTMINLILADFISKFTKQRMAVFDSPPIVCGKQFVHPIHFKDESSSNLSEIKITPPWDIVKLEDDGLRNKCVLNKKGELVSFPKDKHGPQKLVKTTGKQQLYCRHSALEDNYTEQLQSSYDVIGTAVGEDDAVYVVTNQKTTASRLSVYSADGKNTHNSTLKFPHASQIIGMAITNNKNIVIVTEHNVYVCNRNGELLNSFNPAEISRSNYDIIMKSMSVSSDNEIVLVPKEINFLRDSYRLSTYTQDGKFRRTVKFRAHNDFSDKYEDIFYNHATKTIIGNVKCDHSSFIECLSGETGELQCSYLLYPTNFPEKMSNFRLVCHTNGTMALVGKRHVIYLQNSPPSI